MTDKYETLLYQLLPLALNLGRILTEFLRRERERTGMTTEQIFDRAGITLAENEARLLEMLARLGNDRNH